MTVAGTIREKLIAAFAPGELVIEDESARHAGHSGARPGKRISMFGSFRLHSRA